MLLLWASVVCSPLKAGFVCSHRSGSLGNLITRLKALSIRQITRSACAPLCLCGCALGCVCACLQAYTVSAYACVSTGCPLSTTPGSPERLSKERSSFFFFFFKCFFLTQVKVRLMEGVFDRFPSRRDRFLTKKIKRKLNL